MTNCYEHTHSSDPLMVEGIMEQIESTHKFAKYLDLLYNTIITYLGKNGVIGIVINAITG